MKHYLFFDTETSGFENTRLPRDHDDQPHVMQFAAKLVNEHRVCVALMNCLVQVPEGFVCHEKAKAVHGIEEADCRMYGAERSMVVELFNALIARADLVVAHNIDYDAAMMQIMAEREQTLLRILGKRILCTMKTSTPICKLPSLTRPGDYKWPRLEEAFAIFCPDGTFDNAHDAMADVDATIEVFFYLKENGHIPPGLI